MNLHDWKTIAVFEQSTIKETLQVMDTSALQIVLVVNDKQILLGTVTDGDIRRGLLAGATLKSSTLDVMNRQPLTGNMVEGEALWLQKIKYHQIRHLPVLDKSSKIVGLFYQKKLPRKLKTPIILMLGGLGTRLHPLTENTPKPMLPVGEQPILETIVRHIAEQGFEEFYFCINYLGHQIREYFGDGSALGIKINYIEETERMGTAGALSLLKPAPKTPFIVMNGDLLTKIDLTALLKFHIEHRNMVTACVREYSQQVPYGVMEMEGHQVNQIVEKPIYRYFVNGGIYVLDPEAIDCIPDNSYYDMPSLMENMIAKQKKIGGFPITEYWMDIGQMPDYLQAQADYEIHFQRRVVPKI